MKGILGLLGLAVLSNAFLAAGHFNDAPAPVQYKALPPMAQGSLTVFPVVASTTFDTAQFLTLDEGVRSGEVVITETGPASGLIRPRPAILNDGVWRERPYPPPPSSGPQVNQLSLINNASRPLLLLAGEIVTGGKQDRVVSKDLIIPPHSKPVGLGVFCVEPHRWTETSSTFGSAHTFMAQPSVRSKAMAQKNQQQVWDEVAKTRAAIIGGVPSAAAPVGETSFMRRHGEPAQQAEIDTVAKPLEESYETLIQRLRAQNAVGAVVAVNNEIVWADLFASSDLLTVSGPSWCGLTQRNRSACTPQCFTLRLQSRKLKRFWNCWVRPVRQWKPSREFTGKWKMDGDGYTAFVLTSLLPKTGFDCTHSEDEAVRKAPPLPG